MKRGWHKFTALFLSAMLIVGMIPLSAGATTPTEQEIKQVLPKSSKMAERSRPMMGWSAPVRQSREPIRKMYLISP